VIFKNAGLGGVGQATAQGEDRAAEAVREAMTCGSWSDMEISRAQTVALLLESDTAAMQEITTATEAVYAACSDDVNLLFNHVVSEDLEDVFRATVIGTGFELET